MECELEFEAKSYDIDFAGIVSNIVYHRWLEDMRLILLGRMMPLDRMGSLGLVPTLAQTLIDFRTPVRFGERVRARQAITRMGNTSFVFETEMRRATDGQLVALARNTAVLVDARTGRPRPLPEDVRHVLVEQPSFEVRLRGVDEPSPAPSAP